MAGCTSSRTPSVCIIFKLKHPSIVYATVRRRRAAGERRDNRKSCTSGDLVSRGFLRIEFAQLMEIGRTKAFPISRLEEPVIFRRKKFHGGRPPPLSLSPTRHFTVYLPFARREKEPVNSTSFREREPRIDDGKPALSGSICTTLFPAIPAGSVG